MPLPANPERKTLQPSGKVGAVALPITMDQLPHVMAAGDPAATDRALEASWKQLLGSSPVKQEEVDYSGAYGAEWSVVGYEPPESCDQSLYDLVAAACRSADPDIVALELGRLRLATIGRQVSVDNLEAWLIVCGDELEQYPPDVVRCACRKWVRREKWTPAVAELVEECERLVRSRRLMELALRRFGRIGEAG